VTTSSNNPDVKRLQQENQQLREQIETMSVRLEHHERILNRLPQLVYVFDVVAQSNVSANREMAEMLGYSADEIRKMGANMLPQVIHPDDMTNIIPAHFARLARASDDDVIDVEYRMRDSNGNWRWVLSRDTVFARAEDGSLWQSLGVVQDITERKKREDAMRENQQRLQFILEGSSDGAWDWMMDTNEAMLSDRYREMLGYGPDELPDSIDSWISNIHPDDLPTVQQHLSDYLEGRSDTYTIEHRIQHKSGDWRWMLSRGKVTLRDAEGKPTRMTGTVTDITEQKRAEEDWQRLVAIAENSPDFVGMASFEGVPLYVNPAGMAMVGLENMDQVRQHNITDFLPAEEVAFADQEILPTVMRDGFWQGEFRFRHFQTNEPIPVHYTLFLVKDPTTGAPLGIGTVTRDLTEQKRQQAEVSIFKTMADTAPDGFGMADADGTLTYANAAYRNLTGYGDALVGMSFLDHFTEADRARAIEALTTTAEQGDWQGVLNFQRQDGSIIPVDSKGFVTRDEEGNIVAVMGLFRDLSEQYRQEEERAALQQQVIDAQRAALRELSTPLIPISDNVLIMPLIGTIDSQRAQQVMESLLEGVAQHQADLVILDITGVSVVDTQVAQAFIQAAQAVRLLGAQVMLTGIQPQIAQTLVHLGADLGSIITRGSLQSGIATALNGGTSA
jgi:rsbT co-antagonist protein RsbR